MNKELSTLDKVLYWLGFVWCLPVTLSVSLYILGMLLFKQIKFIRWHGSIMEFETIKDNWLANYMKTRWAGFSFGVFNVYGNNYKNNEQVVLHERRHSKQVLLLSFFQPLLYWGYSVICYFFIKDKHPYYDNPFEVDARKSAGQPIKVDWQNRKDENGDVDRWIWF